MVFQTPIAINQSPSLREKAILLVKLMQHVEKRFPEDQDLNAQFLELVNYIYRSVSLTTETDHLLECVNTLDGHFKCLTVCLNFFRNQLMFGTDK